jgi:uncharacterized protein
MLEKKRIKINKKKIEEYCKKHHIQKLSFFGSYLKDDFGPDSDLDILVEFEPGQKVGFIKLSGMERDLSEIFNHKVDLRTPVELSRYFRQEVLDSAKVQYAQ